MDRTYTMAKKSDDELPTHIFSLSESTSSHTTRNLSYWSTKHPVNPSSPPVVPAGNTDFGANLFVADGNHELSPKQEKHQELLRRILSKVVVFGGLFATTFLLGIACQKYITRHAMKEADRLRDELLLDQEKLLVGWAKEKANTELLARFERKAAHKGRQRPVVEHQGENFVALYHHMDLLQKELEAKTHELEKEEKLRGDAEANANDAWGSYQLYTSQLVAQRDNQKEDLSKLFEGLVTEQFGEGPHYVELQLKLPATLDDFFLTIEMAETSLVPLSVFYFLRQVDAGLWDGVSFRFNEQQVISTDPSSTSQISSNTLASVLSMNDNKSALEQMRARGLGHLPFSEYNKSYPHKKYTLGFSASSGLKDRPGPSWYINKVDNTGKHQSGEPCFGKVVIGQDVVDTIGQMKGPGDTPHYIEPVQIVSANVLTKLSEAVGGMDYVKALQDALQKEEI